MAEYCAYVGLDTHMDMIWTDECRFRLEYPSWMLTRACCGFAQSETDRPDC